MVAVQNIESGFPRLKLGTFPTHVQRLERASERAGAEIWVKRDDRSGERYGGNHLRKIEFLLADAQRQGRKRILTYSCLGSNYAVAMALYGQQVGLPCDVVQSYKLPTPALRQNLLLTTHFGAQLYYARTFPAAGIQLLKLLARRAIEDGRTPYMTRAGASAPMGVVGFVLAGLELSDQIQQGVCPKPDVLFVTVSSCGTVAGLLVGLGLAGLRIPVVGVRVVDGWMANRRHVAWLTYGVQRLLRRRAPDAMRDKVELPPFELCHDYFGGGYGAPTDKAESAVAAALEDGLKLENTYTGKTFAAVNDWGARPENRGRTALFWNTYNSVDLSPIVAGLDWHELPQNLWQFFDGESETEASLCR